MTQKNIFHIDTLSAEETENAGMLLAWSLRAGDFVALYGEMGAGKTAFVRGMARVLAPGERVQSPTYTIVNEYVSAGGALTEASPLPVFHFDMYRVDDEDSLLSIGFYEYELRGGVCVCEWSEKIPYALPEKYYRVTITKTGDNARSVDAELIYSQTERHEI